MPKIVKIIFPLLLIVLAVWGVHSLIEPADDGIFHVVLDPGHGGDDPGAVVGEFYEKDINLAIALLVQERLAGQDGITVSMTRDTDSFLDLVDRASYANDKNADLFVSIHANALEDTGYKGIFTFYHPEKRSSKTPAKIIQSAISEVSGGIDRGVRSEDYVVLRETKMPAVLVETGFMTCPEELANLIDTQYQKKLADGIVQGILEIQNR